MFRNKIEAFCRGEELTRGGRDRCIFFSCCRPKFCYSNLVSSNSYFFGLLRRLSLFSTANLGFPKILKPESHCRNFLFPLSFVPSFFTHFRTMFLFFSSPPSFPFLNGRGFKTFNSRNNLLKNFSTYISVYFVLSYFLQSTFYHRKMPKMPPTINDFFP